MSDEKRGIGEFCKFPYEKILFRKNLRRFYHYRPKEHKISGNTIMFVGMEWIILERLKSVGFR